MHEWQTSAERKRFVVKDVAFVQYYLHMLLRLPLGLAVFVGCSSNAGVPKFRTTMPRSLPAAATPRPSDSVRLKFKALPWWTIAGTHRHFILAFDKPMRTRMAGHSLGAIRSENVALSTHLFDAVRCAWKIVPMGEPRPCSDMRRSDAMRVSSTAIDHARSDLRAQAGRAGADAVGDVRCFASQSRRARHANLWCEGFAIVAANAPETPAGPAAPNPAAPNPAASTPAAPDPAAPIEHAPRTGTTRLVLHADASVGMLGRSPIVGTTFGLRYRPFEAGFYIVDLQRESIAPMGGGRVGLGATVLGRVAFGRSRSDGIAGFSALAVASNGATNPSFEGLYFAFAGLAYQTRWRISGVAQPFVQLRAGVARGTGIDGTSKPFLELHFGLSSAERR